MCLFTSAGEDIDFPWLHEVILVLPDGPTPDPETELILSGLVRPKKENAKLVFVHPGEIYGLRNRSSEWLSVDTDGDWLTNKILNRNRQYKKIQSAPSEGKGKYNIRPRQSDLPILSTVSPGQGMLSDVKVYCSKDTFEHKQDNMPKEPQYAAMTPVFCSFSVTFPTTEMQLFRISFKTRFGLRNYHSQIAFNVQGPDLTMNTIREDIANKVPEISRNKELWQMIGGLSLSAKEPQYEVTIVGHPAIMLTIESMENTKRSDDFSMESKEVPLIKSAASPTRVMCFDINSKGVLLQVAAGITKAPEHYDYSQEFLDSMKNLTE